MTQEEKQILLKDLCARLPYNFVYCYCNAPLANGKPIILTPVVISNLMNATDDLIIKPYLRPMSSMTEEEEKELKKIHCQFYKGNFIDAGVFSADDGGCTVFEMSSILDYLRARNFDYSGLIEKSLAIVAPDNMYK